MNPYKLISGPTIENESKNLIELFDEIARNTPDKIAIHESNESISYYDLYLLSQNLAKSLTEDKKITEGSVVAVCLDRSIKLVALFIAIQRIGCAYLPLPKELPNERMQSIALDSNVQLFISDDSRLFLDSIFCQTYESIYLDYSNDQYKSYIYKPKNISYIIYTSGTTGKPKGVSITNDAIKNRMLWVKKYYNFSSKDSILLKYTIDFDPSISELFLPLISGGTMVVCPNKLPLSSSVIINYIEKYSISFINLVPITLRQILHQAKDNECTSLKHIICGGEAWEGELVNKTHKKFPNVSIYNGYGPTETTISVIVWKSTRAHLKGVPPIGKPIQNVHLLIVNEKGHSVNIGETGELWIGGVSVSPGYIGDNSKNSNFISVNVSTNKVIPFYKTGDLVKENPDGNLVYLGRIDNQASINGVRVELEEIESIALKINEVRDVLAIVDNVAGIDFIRLMYTTNSEKLVVKNKIIKIFSEKLRKEVIPTEIIHVEKIPTKINGKVDRSVR